MGKLINCKKAALGGDGTDQSFEQAFSNLAHAYLRDKAPSLLEYEQGFQLLERNDDNTKAVAVTGINVGGQQIYLPVFFLKGDLKGQELLYLKDQDMFVPLKENWVNYILNRKPDILGESVDKSMVSESTQAPDLSQLTTSPGKFAEDVSPWALDYVYSAYRELDGDNAATVSKVASYAKTLDDCLSLKNFVSKIAYPKVRSLVKFASDYPAVGVGIQQFYGDVDFLETGLKTAYQKYRTKQSALLNKKANTTTTGSILDPVKKKKANVTIVMERNISVNSVLPESVPEDISKDSDILNAVQDVEVIDGREEEDKSKLVNIQYMENYFNPAENNVYDVLTADGDTISCFVSPHPYKENGTYYNGVVIPLTDNDKQAVKKKYVSANQTSIWCSDKMTKTDYIKWFKGLPDVSLSDINTAVCITPGGDVVGPFNVLDKRTFSEDGLKIYRISFWTDGNDSDEPTLVNTNHYAPGHDNYFGCAVGSYDNHMSNGQHTLCVSETAGNKAMFTKSKRYIVPKDSKFLVLSKNSRNYNYPEPCYAEEEDLDDLYLATGTDVDNKLWRFKKSAVMDEAVKVAEALVDKKVYKFTKTAAADILSGGLADDEPCKKYDKKQLDKGTEVEYEHTDNKRVAREITKDHLEEIPDYYNRLENMEDTAKKELKLGSVKQVQADLISKTASVKLYNNGRECRLDGNVFSTVDALDHLMNKKGLDCKSSKYVLKAAEVAPNHVYKFNIKLADPYLSDNQVSVPGALDPPAAGSNIMGANVPAYTQFEQDIPITELDPTLTDSQTYNMRPDMMPNKYDALWAQQAAESGQKEIFDTKVMSSLLKNVSSDDMTDDFLGDLMTALDKIGRILFMFYWHGERFSDRYGKADMAELEDSLRNSFEILGDLILFLKQKTIEPYPEEESTSTDLDPVADV